MILSIDPGETIGWAIFTDAGREVGRGKMKTELFHHSIHYKPSMGIDNLVFTPRSPVAADEPGPIRIDKVVVESYYQDPGVKSGGSQGPAQQIIGVMRYLCAQAGIEPVFQRSAILPVAMKHTGYVQDTVHLRDEDSAWLHGMYYLIANGIIEAPTSAML